MISEAEHWRHRSAARVCAAFEHVVPSLHDLAQFGERPSLGHVPGMHDHVYIRRTEQFKRLSPRMLIFGIATDVAVADNPDLDCGETVP